MTRHILVVEDEMHLAEGIRANLVAEGHKVSIAPDGEKALELWRAGGIDLVILDIMLPKLDGFSVCEEIRKKGGQEPILFLTARNSPDDRVRGLELGGDDYLGKPFNLAELLLRVQAMLRRQEWYGVLPGSEPVVSVGTTKVDFRSYEVIEADGTRDLMTQKEAMILKLLVERDGEVVSREEILDRVWGYDVFPSTRTIDNFVVRVRKRFEKDPAHPRHFLTVRGVGYRYSKLPVETDGEESA